MITQRVEQTDEGRRLDSFLEEKIEDLTRSAVQKLIADGMVTKDGVPLKKNYRLRAGDVVDCEIPEVKESGVEAQDIPLDIVYDDEDVCVVNKPRGLVVHPAPGHPDGTIVNALLYRLKDSLSGIGGEMRPGIVHRIDKDTSGLLIIAKNDKAHQALSDQLKDHTLSRIYWALVIGNIKEDEGVIDKPVGRHRTDRVRMAVDQTATGAKEAVTHYTVLERFNGYTLIECRLETGRTHQIRVHLQSTGHPVAGDPLYGPKKDPLHLNGQCLHAKELHFIHPTKGEEITVSSDLPEYFTEVLEKLRKKER